MKKNTSVKASRKGQQHQELTATEKEILHLLTNEYLTVNKIAIRRGVSDRAIRHHIKKLREKGAINRAYQILPQNVSPLEANGSKFKRIRLHGMEFNIKIIYQDQRYKAARSKSNMRYYDGNTVRLYRDSLEVYGNKHFYADDAQKATSEAINYYNKVFSIVEQDLKIIILKPRKDNISLVKAEYAEIHNELAQSCKDQADKVKVYTTEDSKLWFLIDNSFNLNEAETVHSETGKYDMESVVKPFFNDLRDSKPPLPSEIANYIKCTAEALNKVTGQLQEIAQAQLNTQRQLNTIISLYKVNGNGKINSEVVDYVG